MSPLYPGSWHVRVRELEDGETLRTILRTLVGDSIDLEAPVDMEDCRFWKAGWRSSARGNCWSHRPAAPTSAISRNGESAAGYRNPEWQMLWIGHPWLSVRYEGNCSSSASGTSPIRPRAGGRSMPVCSTGPWMPPRSNWRDSLGGWSAC